MRVVTIDCTPKYQTWQHITPLGDIHADSADADLPALRRDLRARDKLTNHQIWGLGDWGDWVLPDDKRHSAGNLRPKLGAATNPKRAILEHQAALFSKLASPVSLMLVGNHEASFNKRHHCDVVAEMADMLPGDVATPGMCCFVRMRCKMPDGGTLTWYAVLHHGAWYGMADLPPGAARWATEYMAGWQLFCFGHNHRSASVRRAVMRPATVGSEAVATDVRLVACGSYLRNYTTKTGGNPGYGEIKGHAPTTIGAPLVRWRVRQNNNSRRGPGRAKRWVEFEIV